MSAGIRIMVVDDEADLARIVRMYLESWQFEVEAFTDPIEALARFRRTLLYSQLS
jgi:CheY-like chemotaxis protein